MVNQGEIITCQTADGQTRLEVKKPVPFYSLDVAISVGYRVKSLRGTLFHIWTNLALKDHLTKGYAVNEKIRQDYPVELRQLVQLVGRTLRQSHEEQPNQYEVVLCPQNASAYNKIPARRIVTVSNRAARKYLMVNNQTSLATRKNNQS